jgi:L-iditol 2-dehydrogenase
MSITTDKAAFINPDLDLYLDTLETPEPAADELLIQVRYTGICGSDIHYYHEGRVGDNVIKSPHILGHESSGIVARVGADVVGFKEGDNVAIEPGVPCLRCSYCLQGHYNLCLNVQFLGAPPYPGSFREYLCHKALFTHRLPDNVDLKTGSLIEPLAVGYNAVSKLALKPSQHLLITGAGPIGLTTMLIARAAGARVTIVDLDDYRLEIARSMGADNAININSDKVEAGQYDCAVEASGSIKAFETLLDGVHKAANLVLVGMTSEALYLNVNALLKKDLSIHTIYRYANQFQPVIAMLASDMIDSDGIITHEFGIDQIVQAFEFATDPAKQKMKIVINFD